MTELEKQAEEAKWKSFDKGGHCQISNRHFDIIYETAFIDGYRKAMLEIEHYAEFCVYCDREGLPLLNYEAFLSRIKTSTDSINLK
jgi:hypothetical protein